MSIIGRRRTALAWRNLVHDVRRLSVAAGGIGFAVLLMFIQIGFLFALLDSTVQLIRELRADLILVGSAKYAMPVEHRFNRARLYQARACPGVAGVYPLYIESFRGDLQRPGHKGYPIRVLAYELDDPVFERPLPVQTTDALRQPRTALIDRRSKPKYGIPSTVEQLREQPFQLARQSIHLIGKFSLGTDFAIDGNVMMSAPNFAAYFPRRAGAADALSLVDIGVVQLVPNADLQQVKERLQARLPEDVRVFTKDEFIAQERQFWRANTPIGYVFTMGVVMGFVVGVIICYQIIYADIADHMAEFATLKAMGYPPRYFLSLVLVESFYLSILGFIPGAILSFFLYQGLAQYTGLLMLFSGWRAAGVLLLTILMCLVSGCLAMRKLMRLDPAELF